MGQAQLIEVPTIDYSRMYYPDILKLLIQYRRQNAPEITDENEYEPYVQLERSFALVGHLNNVLLDVVANESLLPTSKLLESVRNHLRLIDYQLSQASPSSTDVIYELSKIFTNSVEFIPQYTQSRTEETEDRAAVIFESLESYTIDRTDELSYLFEWQSGIIEVVDNALETSDTITVNGVSFVYPSHFSVGATREDTAANIQAAINTSDSDSLDEIIALRNGRYLYIINLDDTTAITLSKSDGAVNNFNLTNGSFSSNKASIANTDTVTFSMFTNPKPGDCLYVAHKHIQWDKLNFIFDTAGSGITGVWEYYDGELEDETPEEVTNLGSTLKFDVTPLLPAGTDYSGAVVRVKLQETSAFEDCISYYSGGKNYIETSELLGQSSPSVTAGDYVIGSLWQPLPDVTDGTSGFAEDGDVDFTLPESVNMEWTQRTINSLYTGYFLRFRIISVSTPVSSIIDRIKIDEGNQYLKVFVTQGEYRSEDPLGSSDGIENQEFTLTYAPLITGSLVLEVDEGTGFTSWSQRDNFLSSNANSKDYVVEIKADDTVIIKFGDGTRGKIPAAGVDNIRVYYRTGADVDGNVGASTITVNKEGISFVNRIWNPRQATGWTEKEGSTEEDLARVKIEGPASIRVLNRGITGPDIEYLTTNYTTSTGSKLVSRSKAIEETFGIKTIENIVVGNGGVQLAVSERQELEDYFNGNKVSGIEGVLVTNHEVTVVNYTKKEIDVVATVYGGNKTEIENAIKNFLHPEAKYSDGVTYRWNFSTSETTVYVRTALLYAIIYEVDPLNISNVVLTSPSADIALDLRELPFAGNVAVTVI